jgi:hypothetical protein
MRQLTAFLSSVRRGLEGWHCPFSAARPGPVKSPQLQSTGEARTRAGVLHPINVQALCKILELLIKVDHTLHEVPPLSP